MHIHDKHLALSMKSCLKRRFGAGVAINNPPGNDAANTQSSGGDIEATIESEDSEEVGFISHHGQLLTQILFLV